MGIPTGTLRGAMSPNMKVVKTMKPVSVNKRGKGYIIDMGQNMAGWIKLRIDGVNAGDSVKIQYAEKLNEDGSLFTKNLRNAFTTDYYVAAGNEDGRWWAPTFVYHGFRYAEITGLDDVTADGIMGEVVSDEMELTGSFECADTILNKVNNNAM